MKATFHLDGGQSGPFQGILSEAQKISYMEDLAVPIYSNTSGSTPVQIVDVNVKQFIVESAKSSVRAASLPEALAQAQKESYLNNAPARVLHAGNRKLIQVINVNPVEYPGMA